MMKFFLTALLSGLSFSAIAQSGGPDEASGEGGPPRWGVGIAVIANDSEYAGEGARVIPFPMVSYNGDRFSFRGLGAEWHFVKTDNFEISALGKFNMGGFKVDDLGKQELARNGIDYRLLDDRKGGFNVGIGAKWSGKAGELEGKLLSDVTGASSGQEATFEYSYPFEVGQGQLSPKVGVTWMSDDLANYNYGTLKKEVARGVVDYKPGSVVVPDIGVGYFRPLGEKWTLMGFAKYSILPDEIKDSPLVEQDKDGTASIFVGFVRGF